MIRKTMMKRSVGALTLGVLAFAATAVWAQNAAPPASPSVSPVPTPSVGASAVTAAGTQVPAANDPQAQLVKQGEYLARAADCAACHTAPKGKPFAGGLPIASPIGTIYSTNITPDKDTGIGNYSLEDFDKAVRHGVAKNGDTLYPAMPYTSYAKVRPADVKALYAYFMSGVQPVAQANKAADIPWPMSMRWPLSIWRKMFAPAVVADAASTDNDPISRGRYLVEGLGHCSACHTPRGFALQEKALTDDSTAFLSGGVVDNFLAKNLRGDVTDGLGNWSEGDITAFLKGGRNDHSAAFGGMTDVVQHSTQYMNDDDLTAIAKYLKTLKPVDPNAKTLAYDDTVAKALRTGTDKSNGALTFLDNCAACHRSTGKGYTQTFPTLALSSTVNSADPTSLIHIVLRGGQMPWTKSAPTQYAMPGFDDRLTDQDVADVLTFVRSSWGNKAPAVTAAQVAKVRKDVGAAAQPQR
ncbi:Gluconate 2-dehydrogenase cytochrome c subunit [Pandoraea morbifera]|uniref:Gluconate 2-dehydrogenase cytochrome c subunit n=1 Tax=Pandoraea morbifera TaxID=2508300 RepID=A0A5E4V690_9BURK|nr:cytochrome c [Pandoraea morbifera]VVE07363.1 Gluconate 2-dehydrogenase cytochrome c subunit [Pandoraea morbifera]